ncbi:uncharacterized protein LOC126904872 isoform X2 [Daktulosphaira vitifoliae]|uniref:uncharacterized protein LOC126904872 isoform X2 n=1 Tax=Daktulosphaira vitifoliae TaxID=58002 RepID=UPI0021AA631C|nr:uncharacterized protein LOC126904872 isoform X2 [Daktulosphaira vitifoliae]
MAIKNNNLELTECLKNFNLENDSVILNYSSNTLLNNIKQEYESIFSWDIYEKTRKSRYKINDIINILEQKRELISNENRFSTDRYSIELVICFETFLEGNFVKALNYIEDTIKYLENLQSDEFYQQISCACFHIAHATQAYIKIYMDHDISMILSKIKPLFKMNKVEVSAFNGIKCKVFLEYSPTGNKIALELAEISRNLNDTEVRWIDMWLKAKGRVRRYEQKFTLPFREELKAAEKLSFYQKNPAALSRASKVYMEAGFVLKIQNKPHDSEKYYNLASNLALKVYNLAENDVKLLYNCFEIYLDLPQKFMSSDIMKTLIKKLSETLNIRIYAVLGKYFMKNKNYLTAKHHLKKAVSNGNFSSWLHLLKVECFLNSQFPIIEFLNSMYEMFTEPKRRLIIISQLLLYYVYNEKNPTKLLHYLKLYLDQDIDYVQKKHHIIVAFPLYHLKSRFNPKNFLKILSNEVNRLKKYSYWNDDENKVLENVLSRFQSMVDLKQKGMERYLSPVSNPEMKTDIMQYEDSETKIVTTLKHVTKERVNVEDSKLNNIHEGCEKFHENVHELDMTKPKIAATEGADFVETRKLEKEDFNVGYDLCFRYPQRVKWVVDDLEPKWAYEVTIIGDPYVQRAIIV